LILSTPPDRPVFREWNRTYHAYGWREKELLYADDVRRFMFAGKAAFDIYYMALCHARCSVQVGETADPDRYLVSMKAEKDQWVHVGIANSKSLIFEFRENPEFMPDSQAVRDFEYLLQNIRFPKPFLDFPDAFIVQHYGRCGRCQCELKHPRSIAIGICAKCNKAIGRRRWPPLRPQDPYGPASHKRMNELVESLRAAIVDRRGNTASGNQ
jgi:hypothetical protein